MPVLNLKGEGILPRSNTPLPPPGRFLILCLLRVNISKFSPFTCNHKDGPYKEIEMHPAGKRMN